MKRAEKAAASARIGPEEQRRLEEKIACGKAVLSEPPAIVCGVREEAAEPEDRTETVGERAHYHRMGTDGQGREVYYTGEPMVIITGVPRDGRDDPAAVERMMAAAEAERGPEGR